MLRRVALVSTDISKEFSASFIRVTRIGELGATLPVNSVVPSSTILVTPMKDVISFSETSVLIGPTRSNIQKTPLFVVTAVKTSNLTNLTNLIFVLYRALKWIRENKDYCHLLNTINATRSFEPTIETPLKLYQCKKKIHDEILYNLAESRRNISLICEYKYEA
jgi:hypothetical protein